MLRVRGGVWPAVLWAGGLQRDGDPAEQTGRRRATTKARRARETVSMTLAPSLRGLSGRLPRDDRSGAARHCHGSRLLGAYSFNNVTAQLNDDGSLTVHFGACGDCRIICLPIEKGWNYAARMYDPCKQIVDGDWAFPEPVPLNY